MNDEVVMRDIFNALDTGNEGFISKQHFINQMAEYLSQTEIQCTDYALKKLKVVNNYPDLIDYEDFRQFYQDLMDSKTSNEVEKNEDLTEFDLTDSEIYENKAEPTNDIGSSRSTLLGSVINLRDQNNTSLVSLNPSSKDGRSKCHSPKRLGRKQRRSSDLGGIQYRSSLNSSSCCFSEDIDELSCITDSGISVAATEEMDKLMVNYHSVVNELSEFKHKLDDSNLRYQKQREVTKYHNERIMMLEEQIRNLEISQNEELESKKKDVKNLSEILQQKRDQELDDQEYKDKVFRENVLKRLATIESEYNFSRKEYEKIKKEYDIIVKEKDQLKKDLKSSEKRYKELELNLMSYKSNINVQIEDLQRERDNAEKLNKELTDKLRGLETISQIPTYRCGNIQSPSISNNSPPANTSSRPLSWTGPFHNFLNNTQTPSKSGSVEFMSQASISSSSPSCTTISQLEQIVHRLTMENRNLVEKVNHLETLEFYQRPGSIMNNISNNLSLADELEQLNYTELKNALTQEREVASRLHIYVISLTNRLMQAGYIEAFRQKRSL